MAQKRRWECEDLGGEGEYVILISNDWDNKEFMTDDRGHAVWLTDMLNDIEKFVGSEI